MRAILILLLSAVGLLAQSFEQSESFLAAVQQQRTVASGASITSTNDNFNRTENPLASGWTTGSPTGFGAMKSVASYAIYVSYIANKPQGAYWSADTFNANQYSQCKILINGTPNPYCGPAVRMSSTDGNTNFYHFQVYTNGGGGMTAKLFAVKVYGAAMTELANISTTDPVTAGGLTLKLTASGTSTTTLTAYTNGVQILTYNDSSSPLTTGQPGILEWASGGRFDDWEGGNYSP